MSNQFKKIYIVCPADYCSGGPESLHNLVKVMQSLDIDAAISYLPYREEINPQYKEYKIPVEKHIDHPGNLIIFPEILCMQALSIKKAKSAIWWLSLDNFLETKYGTFRDKIRYLIKVIKLQRPIFGIYSLKKLIHFSKAHYDTEYLKAHNIKSKRIEGPISRKFLNEITNIDTKRSNEILYNEKKSKKLVQALKIKFPKLIFTPLKNMSEAELITQYKSAKLYIDFGTHPGKERMPREAALMGCCIMTGRLGAAGNNFDIPIPDNYKLDQNSADFFDKFEITAIEIMENYENVIHNFDTYRSSIVAEFDEQSKNIKSIFT